MHECVWVCLWVCNVYGCVYGAYECFNGCAQLCVHGCVHMCIYGCMVSLGVCMVCMGAFIGVCVCVCTITRVAQLTHLGHNEVSVVRIYYAEAMQQCVHVLSVLPPHCLSSIATLSCDARFRP